MAAATAGREGSSRIDTHNNSGYRCFSFTKLLVFWVFRSHNGSNCGMPSGFIGSRLLILSTLCCNVQSDDAEFGVYAFLFYLKVWEA